MTQTSEMGQRSQDADANLLELIESHHIGTLQHYKKGRILYWQGDPVEQVFVIKKGAVKVFSLSREGKAYTYTILGVGGMIGATAYLLGKEHESIAEAMEDTYVIALPPREFEHLLTSDPRFSATVTRQLAQNLHSLSGKVRELSFLDVQQRLKHTLMRLADQYGLATDRGVKIDLHITHKEIGELIAANRTTITSYLNELKRQGYLWQEGHRLVIIAPEHMEILDNLSQSVLDGDDLEAMRWARKAVEEGVDPTKALDALIGGMRQVDRAYVRDEIGLPDVVMAAYAMKSAIPIVEEQIERTGKEMGTLGTVVIGTVRGDIHDIGKTIVAMLLKTRGFKVIDLGFDVTAEQFVKAVREYAPNVLAMSALTTTTAPEQRKVIKALKEEGLRDEVKVMVGGGAITRSLAGEIEADGYEPSARRAVELAWRLTTQT